MAENERPARPEVAYGGQHAVNPEVSVGGPLGSVTIKSGGEPVEPVEQHPNEGEQAEEQPEEPQPADEPEADDTDPHTD